MIVLDSHQCRAFDSWATSELGVPNLVLMENAAAGVVQELLRRWPEVRACRVLCGPGNNGADGLAIARLLRCQGYTVSAALLEPQRIADDGGSEVARQLDWARRVGVEVTDGLPERDSGGELIVDALFGTGLSRPLQGRALQWVEWCNRRTQPVVAVDSPSGLLYPHPRDAGCVEATLTVTFVASKVPQWIGAGSVYCGEVVVAPIGVPLESWPALDDRLQTVDADAVSTLLGEHRSPESHKGTYGHLLLIAGSLGMSGAAVMAARAALRSGVGLLTVAAPEAVRGEIAAQVPEAMTIGLHGQGLQGSHIDDLLDNAAKYSAVATGPGLGSTSSVASAVRRLCEGWVGPVVLDADALGAFAGPEALAQSLSRAGDAPASRAVITPHPGELGRLVEKSAASIQEDRLEAATSAAQQAGCCVLLKGHHTLVAHPDGRTRINTSGNPGMATGGSGDVLTGVVGALLANGLQSFEAAYSAAWVHGHSGDLAAGASGERGLTAGDLIRHLPASFRSVDRS